jgi:hypothetical protein
MFWGKRNLDGGPKTKVFAFSLERERETARRLVDPSAFALLNARFALIDEVQAYRETGRLTEPLLQACEAELELAPRNRTNLNVLSVGMRRLCELAADGHQAAADRVRREFGHARSERRLTAYEQACASWFEIHERAAAYRDMLADRSGDLRQVAAEGASNDLLFDLIPVIEAALPGTKGERARSRVFEALFDLKERARLGLSREDRLPDASHERRGIERRQFEMK